MSTPGTTDSAYFRFVRDKVLTEVTRLRGLLLPNEERTFALCLEPGKPLEEQTDEKLKDLYSLLHRSGVMARESAP